MYKDCALTMSLCVLESVGTLVCVSVCLCVHRLYTDLFQNKHARTHTYIHIRTYTLIHTHTRIHTYEYRCRFQWKLSSRKWCVSERMCCVCVSERENTLCHHVNVLRNVRLYVAYELFMI